MVWCHQDFRIFMSIWSGTDSKEFEIPSQRGSGGHQTALLDRAFELAISFLERVEAFKNSPSSTKFSSGKISYENDLPGGECLADISAREVCRALSFCEQKCGTSAVADASRVGVNERKACQ